MNIFLNIISYEYIFKYNIFNNIYIYYGKIGKRDGLCKTPRIKV